MLIKIYQVDAFTDQLFSGNPASVCPLEEWLPDDLLQNIAMENNQAETCFYVNRGDFYDIRWFTPSVEVALCGHATLAAAWVILNYENYRADEINFISKSSGVLRVTKRNGLLTLNFPIDIFSQVIFFHELTAGFSIKPIQAYKGKTDYMLVYKKEEDIKQITVDLSAIAKLDCRGVIITAPGSKTDFVSRFFAPQSGIPEDPVTGSTHTTLVPYWANKLSKSMLTASQLSKRGGTLFCEYKQDRVFIAGYAKTYLVGEIFI